MTDQTDDTRPHFLAGTINLASALLGARALDASDDFFAPVSRMLADEAPVFIADKYDENGKWMDGWESRRRRGPGHDHATVRLATPGHIRGFNVDTSHFTGNFPPACRIEAALIRDDDDPDASTPWTTILPMTPLSGDRPHFMQATQGQDDVFSHIRLHIHPDGGVARLRVFGQPFFDWAGIEADGQEGELSGLFQGGRIIAWSDAHYGAVHRLLAPGRGLNMGDGWETRRRREPGHDWIIIALGRRGVISSAEIDTAFYKGNYPDMASLQGADLSDMGDGLSSAVVTASMFWEELMSPQKLQMDAIHHFTAEHVRPIGPVSHVRLNIHPDGGVSRLRLFGKPA